MILVTGATGLVGSHLLFHFASRGVRVRALARNPSRRGVVERLFGYLSGEAHQLLPLVEWVEGDVTCYHSLAEAMDGVTQVYHCAAMVGAMGATLRELLEANVGGTAHMVDLSLARGVKGFCHVSSIAALGHGAEGIPVDEATEWGKSKGKTDYAISKFRAEMEVWRGIELGLPAVIVNPSVIIGPGAWGVGSGKILGAVAKGVPFYPGGTTGYVDARDVVLGMVAAMERGRWGRRYLLSAESGSHRQVMAQIALAMGRRQPFIPIPPGLIRAVWAGAWLLGQLTRGRPLLSRDAALGGQSRTIYSAQRAQQELGIQFIPLAQAIAHAVAAGDLGRATPGSGAA